MKPSARIIIFGFFILLSSFFFSSRAVAQEQPTATPTPTLAIALPGEANWVVDPEVTQVGRNAERARQFIYWVVKHRPVLDAPILAETWVIVRNISFLLVVFVIVGLAVQLVLSRQIHGPTFSGISIGFDKITLFSVGVRVFMILAFIIFSFVLVKFLIQLSEVSSNFFIERLGGQDLFNIVFSSSNTDGNYDFVGYRNADPLEQDMVSTSLLVVRFTSFTYNFMGVLLILRQIILLFLLVLSPFLALLLPFIFIRNTGWIWIGEFFRWLLYGPLFALFIAALARIWKAGIPYQFDFTRAENGEMVYQTGINILYGGPAQVLSPTNTANYVDTYAEYIIALVMLWTAILLPWLLLKIFRDYCCDILEKNQGVLMQILDKIRSVAPRPPSPAPVKPAPTGTFGQRIAVSESRPFSTREILTRERIVEKINNSEIKNIETRDITRAYDLRMSSLREVARYDTQRSQQTALKETLANIQNPYRVSNPAVRKQFENLRNEFTERASRGDQLARQVIEAATPRASQIKQTISSATSHQQLKQAVEKPGQPVSVSPVRIPSTRIVSPRTVQSIAEKTGIEEHKVEAVLKEVVSRNVFEKRSEEEIRQLIDEIAQRLDIAARLINEIITAMAIEHNLEPNADIYSSAFIQKIAQQTHIPETNIQKLAQEPGIKEVISQREREMAEEERIKQISKRIDITKDQINTIIKESEKEQGAQEPQIVSSFTIREVSEKTQIPQEEVEKILEIIPAIANLPREQQVGSIAEKTGIAPNKVKRVLDETPPDQMPKETPPTPAPTVSIEEYEEIRTMWMNHYRHTEVPKSETITSREKWIQEDIKNLTNSLNLLISTSEKDRQKGTQQVSDLLPFLLLGGFTDIETLTYIKAKLEAAKLIMQETKKISEAKEQGKKEAEDIEIIPAVEPKEELKADQLEQALEMPIPEDGEDKKEGSSDLPGFSEEGVDTEKDSELDKKLPFRTISTVPTMDKKK
jgi:hypothetical protein